MEHVYRGWGLIKIVNGREDWKPAKDGNIGGDDAGVLE
jgi:hypothetical protein